MRFSFLTFLILILIMVGCSDFKSPVNPVVDKNPISEVSERNGIQIISAGTMNLDTGFVAFNQRSVMPYYDVTNFVGSNFSFTIDSIIPPDVLDITLTINNPSFYVHDVCLVFEELNSKSVENPDSYIDIWDPYDLDPVIQFRKEASDRYFFPTTDDEELLLKWPNGASPLVDFFIIAHLGGNTGGVVMITPMQNMGELTPSGGSMDLLFNIKDHQGDTSLAIADTTIFTGGLTFLDPINVTYWHTTITNSSNAPVGTYTIPLMATSPSSPQYNTYYYMEIEVTPDIPGQAEFSTDIDIINDNTWDNMEVMSGGHHGLAVDDSNFYLAFSGDNPSGNGAIFFTKSSDSGVTWSNAVAITPIPGVNRERRPSIAADNGNIYIAYEDFNGSIFHIRLLVSTDNGVNWNDYQVSELLYDDNRMTSLCIDPSSSPTKIYVAYILDDVFHWVRVASTDTNNLTSWLYGSANSITSTSLDIHWPSIAFNPVTNYVMLAWSQEHAGSGYHERIFFDKSSDGITWGTEILVSDNWQESDDETFPSLAVNSSSGVPAILYRHEWDEPHYDAFDFVKATDNTAISFNSVIPISDLCTGIAYACSLACDSSGHWFAAWCSNALNTTNYETRIDESLDDGITWGIDRRVNDLKKIHCRNPNVIANGTDVCVAWTDGRKIFGEYEVYVDHGTY